jgi:hypothetical protein
VVKAAGSLPPERIGVKPYAWSTKPIAGNYNPCATLSVAIVSIAGGSGSSPRTALLFHQGAPVGMATRQARSFVRFDAEHSTDDTVVLDFDTPGSCDACAPAATAQVRFQWQGDHFATLDPLPGASPMPAQGQPAKFVSPSGNIVCSMTPSGTANAMCEIRHHTWPSARPCQIGVGDRFNLTQGQAVNIHCHTDSAFEDGLPTLEYGDNRAAGTITCESAQSGIACKDSSTGHFFELSQESFHMG